MLSAQGGIAASLVLVDCIWSRQRLDVSGEIVIAVPTPDLLLVTGSEDANGVAKIREMAHDACDTLPHALSRELFVRRNDHWVTLQDKTTREFDRSESRVAGKTIRHEPTATPEFHSSFSTRIPPSDDAHCESQGAS